MELRCVDTVEFSEARSRLCRRRFFRSNAYCKAFGDIFQIDTLLYFPKLDIFFAFFEVTYLPPPGGSVLITFFSHLWEPTNVSRPL